MPKIRAQPAMRDEHMLRVRAQSVIRDQNQPEIKTRAQYMLRVRAQSVMRDQDQPGIKTRAQCVMRDLGHRVTRPGLSGGCGEHCKQCWGRVQGGSWPGATPSPSLSTCRSLEDPLYRASLWPGPHPGWSEGLGAVLAPGGATLRRSHPL